GSRRGSRREFRPVALTVAPRHGSPASWGSRTGRAWRGDTGRRRTARPVPPPACQWRDQLPAARSLTDFDGVVAPSTQVETVCEQIASDRVGQGRTACAPSPWATRAAAIVALRT